MATLPRTEHAVARSLAQTADPHDALVRALRAIGEGLGWLWGAVWEPAPDRPEALCCVETWSADGAAAEAFAAASRECTFAPGEGLPGRVWQSGEPAWISDVLTDDNFPRATAAQGAGLHAAFCFPIRSARGVLGVIEFFSAEPHEPDGETLATMAILGDQIGQAVERRRDAETLREKEARHRAMLDAALDCVVTMDHEGRVVDFNPAAERTFGYSAPDVAGREMAELIVPPELRDRHRLPARHHRAQGGRGRAAGVAGTDRRGGRRGTQASRARPPRRCPAAPRRARPDHAPGARQARPRSRPGRRAARRGARRPRSGHRRAPRARARNTSGGAHGRRPRARARRPGPARAGASHARRGPYRAPARARRGHRVLRGGRGPHERGAVRERAPGDRLLPPRRRLPRRRGEG